MSISQITCQPKLHLKRASQFHHLSSKPDILPAHATIPLRSISLTARHALDQKQCMPILKNQKCRAASMYYQPSPVCLLGGKGNNGSDNEGSSWKAHEDTTGSLKKELTIEDILRKQIENKEFYKDNTSAKRGGGNRGGRGGGGKGGGGSGGSNGSEGGGFGRTFNETLQVILATIGVVFLYISIISGEEWILLAKDYLKFLFTGSESLRLKCAMNKWNRFFRRRLTKKLDDGFRSEEHCNQQSDLVEYL